MCIVIICAPLSCHLPTEPRAAESSGRPATAAVPQSGLQRGDCRAEFGRAASVAGLPGARYFQRETGQKGLSSDPSALGKVKLVDPWSINVSFSFLNLHNSPSVLLCPSLGPGFCLLLPLISFRITFVHSESSKGKQSRSGGEDFNSACLSAPVKKKSAQNILAFYECPAWSGWLLVGGF